MQVADALQSVLARLQASGYCCGWQIVLGTIPGGWAANWMDEEKVQGELPDSTGPAFGLTFQVSRITLPSAFLFYKLCAVVAT